MWGLFTGREYAGGMASLVLARAVVWGRGRGGSCPAERIGPFFRRHAVKEG
jgi:hypothetical protein